MAPIEASRARPPAANTALRLYLDEDVDKVCSCSRGPKRPHTQTGRSRSIFRYSAQVRSEILAAYARLLNVPVMMRTHANRKAAHGGSGSCLGPGDLRMGGDS